VPPTHPEGGSHGFERLAAILALAPRSDLAELGRGRGKTVSTTRGMGIWHRAGPGGEAK
jgi:hypothetical protein